MLVALFFAKSPCAADLPEAAFTSTDAAISEVFALVDARLALMQDVAANKFRTSQAIVDPVREQAVLDKVVQDSQALGLDAGATRNFFDVQIRLARAIQGSWIDKWRRDADALPLVVSLSELRPRLDAIGKDLLLAIYLHRGELHRQTAAQDIEAYSRALIRHPGVDGTLLRELRDALLAIQVTRPLSKQMIQAAGVLRVGMTGDYAPFSYERDGKLAGFDVELAQALANSFGVKLRFVRTTWPALLDDMYAQRFDIAMSGITVTAARAAQAQFSVAYHIDGKTPISRCENSRRFATLKQIDRPTVRLIVNPGGTNHVFIRDRIKQARVIVHDDNRTIFDELLAKHADVMVTDSIEADLQAMRHKTLCRTTPKLFTQSPKALMLPRDSDLRAAIDEWLAPQVASGAIQELLNQAIDAAR